MYDFDDMNDLSQELENQVDEQDFEDLDDEELDEIIMDSLTGNVRYDDDDDSYDDEDYDEDYDGQPSELDEWMDFDPDC